MPDLVVKVLGQVAPLLLVGFAKLDGKILRPPLCLADSLLECLPLDSRMLGVTREQKKLVD